MVQATGASDKGPTPVAVSVKFEPYSYAEVRKLTTQVLQEFGPINRRWRSTGASEFENSWTITFYFYESRDALLFSLKYAR